MSDSARLISDPPLRQIYEPRHIDHVAEAVIGLTRELWVLTDRIAVMEKVMAERGLDLTEAIDAYVPDQAMQAELEAKRERLMRTVLTALRVEV
jgi:hypothetical protein